MQILRHKWIAFLKLVRIENLLIIAFTQVLLRYFVLQKLFTINQVSLALNDALFAIMVLSTVLVAAAGYIINDYFDLKTDLINHPDTVVVDKIIKRRWAIILHGTLTALGVLLGVYVSLRTGYLRLALFHLFAAVLLWFYSTHFKKQLLSGNILVAVLTAAVVFMPCIFELGLAQHVQPGFIERHTSLVLSALKITVFFAIFAFLCTLAREIIKDLEDYEGDAATGGRTMPIVWGLQSARLFSFFVLLITAILLSVAVYNNIRFTRQVFSVSNIYILVTLILPLLLLGLLVLRASTSAQFKRASMLLKFIMLFGISYCFIFYYF